MANTGHANKSLTHSMEEGTAKYGATQTLLKPREKSESSLEVKVGLLIGGLVAPVLIFLVICFVMGFDMRYWHSFWAHAIAFAILLGIFGIVAAAAVAKDTSTSLWLGILFIFSLIGWYSGYLAGWYIFSQFMQPYYDLRQLNVYHSVDPSKSVGNQYMDFGVVDFTEKAVIAHNMSMHFKNGVTHCVAPLKVSGTNPATYDFWAVGVDCCSPHGNDFRCGDWNLPNAHSGLRVTSESQRQFYELAVKQAATTYDIPVHHPIFFEWVARPSDHIAALQASAVKLLLNGSIVLLCVEFVLMSLAVIPILWVHSSKA